MNKSDKIDEEFNNFMHKVNEVTGIISKLSSSDSNLQAIGDLEAKKYLGESRGVELHIVDEEDLILKVSSSKTKINKNALLEKDEETKKRESFMSEVFKDAEKRYQDKLIRTEKMETFKKRAILAFRRGEYEKALLCYNQAIEQMRDKSCLYNDRALIYIILKFYDKAIQDISWALKLNENSLKSWLLLAKAHFLNGNKEEFENAVAQAKQRNSGKGDFVDEYIRSFEEH